MTNTEKLRLSFIETSGTFKIDFTTIVSGDYNSDLREFKSDEKSDIKYQVEIELLKTNINFNELIKMITRYLNY